MESNGWLIFWVMTGWFEKCWVRGQMMEKAPQSLSSSSSLTLILYTYIHTYIYHKYASAWPDLKVLKYYDNDDDHHRHHDQMICKMLVPDKWCWRREKTGTNIRWGLDKTIIVIVIVIVIIIVLSSSSSAIIIYIIVKLSPNVSPNTILHGDGGEVLCSLLLSASSWARWWWWWD